MEMNFNRGETREKEVEAMVELINNQGLGRPGPSPSRPPSSHKIINDGYKNILFVKKKASGKGKGRERHGGKSTMLAPPRCAPDQKKQIFKTLIINNILRRKKEGNCQQGSARRGEGGARMEDRR